MMPKTFIVAFKTFRMLLDDPFFLIVNLTVAGVLMILPRIPMFAFGGQVQLIREEALSTLLIAGIICWILGVGKIIPSADSGDPLESQPISRGSVTLGRWLGLSWAVGILLFTGAAGAMASVRMAYYPFRAENFSAWIYFLTLVFALTAAGMVNGLFRKRFVASANGLLAFCVPAGMVFLFSQGYEWTDEEAFFALADGRIPIAVLMVWAGLNAYGAVLVLGAVRLPSSWLPGIGLALALVFMFCGAWFAELPLWGERFARALIPELQNFWILEEVREAEGAKMIVSGWHVNISRLGLLILLSFFQSFFWLALAARLKKIR